MTFYKDHEISMATIGVILLIWALNGYLGDRGPVHATRGYPDPPSVASDDEVNAELGRRIDERRLMEVTR